VTVHLAAVARITDASHLWQNGVPIQMDPAWYVAPAK
jgi:hypothetical protein